VYINGVLLDLVSSSYAVTASYSNNATTGAANAITKTGNNVELGGLMYRNTYISGALDTIQLTLKKAQLTYASDYSQFFTSRSMVDKAYVDNRSTGSLYLTGSLTVSGSVVTTNYVNFAYYTTLPTSGVTTGSIASSGSNSDNKPYYWNGDTWTALF
jgi:hypothetical protein